MNSLTRAARAEWLKLRSVRSTWWLVAGGLAAMLLVANGEISELKSEGGAPGSVEAAAGAMAASLWLYFILGSLGMLAITSEYVTRSIMVTLACTPSRTRLLLAKAATVAAAVFATGVSITVLGVATSAPLLGEYVHFDAGQVAGRVLAMGAALALIAVLALGLGTLIRRSAGTLTVLFGLLLVLPVMLPGFAEWLGIPWLTTVAGYLPTAAADRLIAGEPAFGLVLAAWAAAAVAAGIWTLRKRDA